MTRSLLRAAAWSAPAALAYIAVLPALALALDRRLGLSWPFPRATALLALALIPSGAFLAAWCVWLFARMGSGTPNPMAPPERLVVAGPYRHVRNPMMLGGWLAGLGLACLLRSPALLGGLAGIIAAGSAYVRLVEEPSLALRFGSAWRDYAAEVPRWMPRCPHRHDYGLSHDTAGR